MIWRYLSSNVPVTTGHPKPFCLNQKLDAMELLLPHVLQSSDKETGNNKKPLLMFLAISIHMVFLERSSRSDRQDIVLALVNRRNKKKYRCVLVDIIFITRMFQDAIQGMSFMSNNIRKSRVACSKLSTRGCSLADWSVNDCFSSAKLNSLRSVRHITMKVEFTRKWRQHSQIAERPETKGDLHNGYQFCHVATHPTFGPPHSCHAHPF